MKRPAIFFDRDNTLNVSDDYLGDPARVVLMPGAADAVARARSLGYAVVVFSNQSGVARGMFTEDDVRAVNARLDAMLVAANPDAVVDRHEFCPYHPDGTVEAYRRESDLRKPNPGMIYAAAQSLALDLSQSWAVGDAPRDIEAGHAAGLRTVLLKNPALPPSPAALQPQRVKPEATVPSLTEAIAYIAEARDRPPPPPGEPESSAIGLPTLNDPGRSQGGMDGSVDSRSAPPSPALEKIQATLTQIHYELRRHHERPPSDFSVSKLFAGITQVVSIAMMFLAYLNRGDSSTFVGLLLFGLWTQCLTTALLIMERQRQS